MEQAVTGLRPNDDARLLVPSAPPARLPSRRRLARRKSAPSPIFVDPAKLPPMYALTVDGDCMGAEIPSGSSCGFSSIDEAAPGDVVVLWFRPEKVPAGEHQARIKRLVLAPPRWVSFPHTDHPDSTAMPLLIVETSNPARQFGVRCADLMAIHKFIGIVPREQLAMPKVPAEAFALEGQR